MPHKEKNMDQKNKKKICRGPTPDPRQRGELPRVGWRALDKVGPPAVLCRGLNYGPSAKPNAQSHRYSGPTPLSAPSLPRARPSAKMGLDRWRFSAEGPAESHSLSRVGPRHRWPLPSARYLALGKTENPRQRCCFQ